MILHCNYEELRALASGGEAVVSSHGRFPAAYGDGVAQVETLLPRLTGDVSIDTLEDQRRTRDAVGVICDDLRTRMDQAVIEFNPGHEEAVGLYFDYAHTRSVLHRLDLMGAEMSAIVDLITGGHPEVGGGIGFPD